MWHWGWNRAFVRLRWPIKKKFGSPSVVSLLKMVWPENFKHICLLLMTTREMKLIQFYGFFLGIFSIFWRYNFSLWKIFQKKIFVFDLFEIHEFYFLTWKFLKFSGSLFSTLCFFNHLCLFFAKIKKKDIGFEIFIVHSIYFILRVNLG